MLKAADSFLVFIDDFEFGNSITLVFAHPALRLNRYW
jgi:hypothetical protein